MVFSIDPTQIAFYIICIYILICIIMSLRSERVVQAAYWLIFMLLGVAILFLLSNSEILFAYQLIVYAGGISVLLLFASLLTELDDLGFESSVIGMVKSTKTQILIFILFALNLVYLVSVNIGSYFSGTLGDTSLTTTQSQISIRDFATSLWTNYGAIIPIIGLLFLTSMLGSVKLVIREWEIEKLSDEMKKRYRDELVQEVLA